MNGVGEKRKKRRRGNKSSFSAQDKKFFDQKQKNPNSLPQVDAKVDSKNEND